ncbi:MAG: diguanylate cyclase [Nitrospirae bacterium]|nr:diguanylate cyclase [Nitrospirota bacterium]
MPKELILIVEDSRTQLQAIEMSLKKEGFRVITAKDGIEGYHKVITGSPDLIISDINLPELNGYQFCRLIKNENTTSSIPVILLTSLGQKQDRFWGLKAGADRYILKDTSMDTLVKEVKALIDEKSKKIKGKQPQSSVGDIKDATIMSRVNYLFDKLLFEATIMGEIKNLATFVNDRTMLLNEFFKIMTALFDFKASGFMVMSEDSPTLYLDLNDNMLSEENIKTIKDNCCTGLGDVKQFKDIKIEIISGMEYNTKKIHTPYSITSALNIHKECLGNISLFNDREYNINNKNTLSLIGKDLAVVVKLMLLYEENERLSITDGLTKIYNRRYFNTQIEKEFEKAKRYNSKLTLIMLDIDHFKALNDTYGHQQGDMVLVHLGKILKENIRSIDLIARYGGEEFAVLMSDVDKKEGAIVAEKLRKKIGVYPFPALQKDAEPLKATISIGVAEYSADMNSTDDLVKSADSVLYKAKKDGRNRVKVHE